MYGCANYYYDDYPKPCDEGAGGLGWAAFAYFVLIVMTTGFVLPILLVGVISISFEESKTAVRKDALVQRLKVKVIDKCRPWHPGVDLDEARRMELVCWVAY